MMARKETSQLREVQVNRLQLTVVSSRAASLSQRYSHCTLQLYWKPCLHIPTRECSVSSGALMSLFQL